MVCRCLQPGWPGCNAYRGGWNRLYQRLFANVYAYDAGNGELLWQFDPHVKLDASLLSSWGVRVNRGVAVWNGMVYVGTGDCRLIAIDATSGTKVWETPACDPEQNYAITGAPRVANNLIFIGSSGSDYGARGFVAAFDAETGKEVWRFWTVPGDPAKGFENKAMEMAARTWTGEAPWKNGGGAVWEAMTYDPEFNQLIIGVAGGVPWDPTVRSPEGGDNLFLCSLVALDADTGEYRWHYQQVPRDAWDYDASMHIMLADLNIAGKQRKVLMQAPKNGFFYVLDRIKTLDLTPDQRIQLNSFLALYGDDTTDKFGLPGMLKIYALGGWNYDSFADAETHYRIETGTLGLINRMVEDSGAKVRLGTPVYRIEQDKKHIKVITEDDEEIIAAAAILTIPLNTYRNLEFMPALSPEKQVFVKEGQLSKGAKLYVHLKQNLGRVFAFCDEQQPLNWVQTHDYGDDIGTILSITVARSSTIDLNDDDAVARATMKLFPGVDVLGSAAWDWNADPYSMGAWPAYGIGQQSRIADLQRTQGRLFFGGAITANGWHEFIDGAVESGLRTAREVHSFLE